MRAYIFARALRVALPVAMLCAFAWVSTVSAETQQIIEVPVFDSSQEWDETYWSLPIPEETITSETLTPDETTTTIYDGIETTTTSQLETPQTSSTVAEHIPQIPIGTTIPTQQTETTTITTTSTTLIQENKTTTTTSTIAQIDAIPQPISSQQGIEIASNQQLLSLISTKDAELIFTQLDEKSLSDEQAAEIIAAVEMAPKKIREIFEDNVELFGGAFDEYEMIGQTITVSQRRTIIAVGLLTTAITASISIGATGNTGATPSLNGVNNHNQWVRKNEEEESGMVGEISGDGVDWVKSLSIYKTIDGEKIMDWKAFLKKFWFGVMNMGFTIAGSVVVYSTLSGSIQKIALVSTLMAFSAAMYLHMSSKD